MAQNNCSTAGRNLPTKRRSRDGKALANCKSYYKNQYNVLVKAKGAKSYKKLYDGWKTKAQAERAKAKFLKDNPSYGARLQPRAKGQGELNCQKIGQDLAKCKTISKTMYTVLKRKKGAKTFKRAFIGYKSKSEAEAYKSNFMAKNTGYELRLQPKVDGKKTSACKTTGRKLAECKKPRKKTTSRSTSKRRTSSKSTSTSKAKSFIEKRREEGKGGGFTFQRVKDGRTKFNARLINKTKGEQGK